ncbi:SDR family NAD(P)-dependent oxidoreductase [Streptomyces sp. NPDC059009]|uniref:SDR family NAD(P)-dependent oxidoreductase n=1 Tax=Streptomyces sp. NPDC059009 TaxID=3346694 RepID=UPI00369A951E
MSSNSVTPGRSLPLAGKVALVTGGSRGIGAETARRLAADGADVALTYVRGAEPARDVVADIEALGRRALAVQADAADPAASRAAVERTVAELGRLDILVNNAGTWSGGPLEALTVAQFDEIIAVNVRSVFAATQAAAGHLGEGGRIVTIGSCQGDRVTGQAQTLYAMSKSALNGFTKGVALELGERGITANLVAPGPIRTDMTPTDPQLVEGFRSRTKVGRLGTTTEVAALVSYLAGPDAGFTTGGIFAVDGGTNI